MAVHPRVDAGATTPVAGVTAMLVRVAGVTVSCAVPVAAPNDALMVTLPVAIAAASPLAPELPIVATVLSLDVQATSLVMVWVVESLNDPVAAKSSCVPGAIEVIEGATEIDVMVAFVTLRLTEAL